VENYLQVIFDHVLYGRHLELSEVLQKALDQGIPPKLILDEGLIKAMDEVGDRFENGSYYIPEMILSARAMKSALKILEPYLREEKIQSRGKLVIGTVKGDLHDIGKNLVALAFQGAGYEVVDLGIDVAPSRFVEAMLEHHPDIIGLSALLTTTMLNMKATIQAIEEAGFRNEVKILLGGAPLSDSYAEEVGADGYATDAFQGVALAKRLLGPE